MIESTIDRPKEGWWTDDEGRLLTGMTAGPKKVSRKEIITTITSMVGRLGRGLLGCWCCLVPRPALTPPARRLDSSSTSQPGLVPVCCRRRAFFFCSFLFCDNNNIIIIVGFSFGSEFSSVFLLGPTVTEKYTTSIQYLLYVENSQQIIRTTCTEEARTSS